MRTLLTATAACLLLALAAQLCAGGDAIAVDRKAAEVIQEARALEATDPKAAQGVLEAYLAQKRTPAVLYQLGLLKARRGATDSATRLFREVTQLEADFPGAQKNLGRLLARAGRLDEAAAALRAGIASEGPDGESCALLGQCYLSLDAPFAAETALRWALVQKPKDPRLHLSLAQALYLQSRYVDSERAALLALRALPAEAAAWTLIANSRIAGRRQAEAIDALEALRCLAPKVETAVLWTLGDLYMHEGLIRPAADVYGAALAREEPSAERLRSLARAFFSAQDSRRAAAFAQRLLKAHPQDATALMTLGKIALQDGKRREAKELFGRALKSDPLQGDALIALGDLALAQKRVAQAIAHYRSARAILRFEEVALRAEADALLQESRFTEALKVLDVLRNKYPGPHWDALIREIRMRIREAQSSQ